MGTPPIPSGCPTPENCELYYVDRDTLFSYDNASEAFLQRIMALMVSSHYKNSPNDLQMLSDAPAHHLFALLGPLSTKGEKTHEVLCVIQVCLEGGISSASVMQELARGRGASGDLIPWTLNQQFLNDDFPKLSGARIIRIATHTSYQGMGYGSRALQLLEKYYEDNMINIEEPQESRQSGLRIIDDETVLKEGAKPRKLKLLLKLSERKPERLDYLGVSFGLTESLLKFWKKAGFLPLYLRQTANDLTGEHSCIMLKMLRNEGSVVTSDDHWLQAFGASFRDRFISNLAGPFRNMSTKLALAILNNKSVTTANRELTRAEMRLDMEKLQRLEHYSRNLADYHLITDIVPTVSQLYCNGKMGDTHLTALQTMILIGVGCSVKELMKSPERWNYQLHSFWVCSTRRCTKYHSISTRSSRKRWLLSSNHRRKKPYLFRNRLTKTS